MLMLMMVPTIVIFIINAYLPMFGLAIAFKQINYSDGIWGSPWVGFSNFEFLFSGSDAWLITRNTVLYNLVFIVSGLLFAVTIAVLMNEIRQKWFSTVYQTIFIMPNFMSMVILAYIVYAFLSPTYGYLNDWFVNMGWTVPNFYGETKWWPYILPLANLWKGLGMSTVVYLAAIAGISEEYYEAAVIDGASKWQQIRHITLPLLAPTMIVLTVLAVGNIFRSDFGLFYQVPMNSSILYPVTDTIDTYVYRSLIQLNDLGMSSAATFYQSAVGLLMVIITNGIIRKVNKDHALF
ncbi:sugar ABC transporter permease [Paenibacillus swuensis]|uniref:Sugar ABC transporter permease n=2 Tax=Paenibacillus swuensis TaxID=1178515 RepID=A0A172TPD3_9BACL|nr:sugar ABC transporter permease [Paenibacillus swuensis]